MRMDPSAPRTAADVVNTYPTDRLARVLRVYGEERFATPIAPAITRERERAPFTRAQRLARLVRDPLPGGPPRTGGAPPQASLPGTRLRGEQHVRVAERGTP